MLQFDHVSIPADRLEKSIAFYEKILGMKSGRRPNFPSTEADALRL